MDTRLVGIFNALMKNKGAITREKWRMFCSDAVLLPMLDSFVLGSADRVKCAVRLRYYRPGKLVGRQLKAAWYLKRQADGGKQCQEALTQTMPCGEVTGRRAADGLEGTEGLVLVTNDNRAATEACRAGRSVLLFVKPGSVLEKDTLQGDYCTDFWCYPMFRSISESAGKPVPVGTMGLLIDDAHPAYDGQL